MVEGVTEGPDRVVRMDARGFPGAQRLHDGTDRPMPEVVSEHGHSAEREEVTGDLGDVPTRMVDVTPVVELDSDGLTRLVGIHRRLPQSATVAAVNRRNAAATSGLPSTKLTIEMTADARHSVHSALTTRSWASSSAQLVRASPARINP